MRITVLLFVLGTAYAVDMPFFFDATRAPEIFRDQLGMREAMDVWGQMIRKMTNGERIDNVRQQVLRPKKVDKSVLKSVPKARGEIINERLLNMLLPRVRQEVTVPTEDSKTTSPQPSTTKTVEITTQTSTVSTEAPTTKKTTTKTVKATTIVSSTAAPSTSTIRTSQKETTVVKLSSIDPKPEHKDEDEKPTQKKAGNKEVDATKTEDTSIMKNPKLSVRIHTANQTHEDTMDSAVMSILMEKIDHKKGNTKNNRTEVATTQQTTNLYTEEIRSRNVLKEKNLESEELFKDHEASSLLLHGAELLDKANSTTIADIKQLIEKIEQEVSNSTEEVKVPTPKTVLSSTISVKETESTKGKKNESPKIEKVQSKEVKEDDVKLEAGSVQIKTTTTDPDSTETENDKDVQTSTMSPTTPAGENDSTMNETENNTESEETVDEKEQDETTETQEEVTESDVEETDEKVQDTDSSEKTNKDKIQNRIPEAEDEAEDSPAFVQSDDVNNQADQSTARQNIDGDAAAGGTVYNIQANANSDSKPVQTSVITPITGILDSIRPLMYYFTRPMQAAGVKSFEPENDPNYYGYQKVSSPQQLTLSDLTANIAKRLLSSGSTKSEKSRWNPASIQDLQKNILQSYGGNTDENQLVPLEKIVKSSTETPKPPQVLTVEGSSQKEETEYYAPILPKQKSTLPIIMRPSVTKPIKHKTTTAYITTTTESTSTLEEFSEESQSEEFEDDASSSVNTNFLGDSGVLLGGMSKPEPIFKEPIPFALNPVTDEAPFPMTYKTFGGGSFGGGRRPSIPLTEDSNSSSDILSFFDSKQR